MSAAVLVRSAYVTGLKDKEVKLLDGTGKSNVSEWIGKVKASDAFVKELDAHLLTRVYIADEGFRLTSADLTAYAMLHPVFAAYDDAAKLAVCNVARWLDHMQHDAKLLGVLPAIPIPGVDSSPAATTAAATPAASSAATPAAPAAAAPAAVPGDAAGGDDKKKGKDKKDKEARAAEKAAKKAARAKNAPAPTPEGTPLSRLEIRVGKIVDVSKHPDADSLYVEKIDLGEESGPRTIVSGLVKFIPIEQMQDARVVVMCNLKPASMRGIKSAGMVLCATSTDGATVELLTPPEGAAIGELISFAGHDGPKDAPFLPPKKKIFEAVQPSFKTTADRVCVSDDIPFMTSAGPVTVASVVGGSIK